MLVPLIALAAGAAAICPDQKLRPVPANPSQGGAYDVGAVELVLTKKQIKTEIWYPAVPGSGAGRPIVRYDLREFMPQRHEGKIPDEENPWSDCDRLNVTCHRDLPLDVATGPFPVMVFIHGTAGFRYQSLTHVIHWASRGFIVISADNPGINLGDLLELPPVGGADQAGDARALLESLAALDEPGMEFLRGSVDMSRVAASGHSAGGSSLSNLGDVADVLVPMAARGVNDGPRLKASMVLGGVLDDVVSYTGTVAGFESSPEPTHLVGVSKSGHSHCADFCYLGRENGGLVEIAVNNGIREAELFRFLAEDGCDYDGSQPETYSQPEDQWPVVNYASSAVLEEVLLCEAKKAQNVVELGEDVYEYRERR